MTETVVVTDTRIDPDRFMLEGVEASALLFTVSEVAKVFFARTSHWMRWLEVEKRAFIVGGTPEHSHKPRAATKKKPATVCTRCHGEQAEHWHDFAEVDGVETADACVDCGATRIGTGRTEKGARTYTLGEVEEIVHALAEKGHINGAQAANALHIVQTIARVHGYLA